jgi:hypothetical protein
MGEFMKNYAKIFLSFSMGRSRGHSRVLPVVFIVISGFAIAGTLLASFSVAASPGYATQTYATDADNEYPAAVALFTQYMIPLFAAQSLGGAAAQNKASKAGDYMRVTYADGTKVDFTINPTTVGIPIAFSKKVASDATQHLTVVEETYKDTVCAYKGTTFTFSTGYWGQSWPDGAAETDATWVDTGDLTYTFPATVNCK